MNRFSTALITLAVVAIPIGARAQQSRADLTGPFIHFGGLAGTVTRDDGPIDDSHTGVGWGIGAGVNLSSWFSVVGNHSSYGVKDQASNKYDLKQSEIGVRLRVGGDHTPVVFYIEGGGAVRRATLSTGEVYGASPPPNAGSTVELEGWAGWFGPGAQYFCFGRRLPLELSVAWGWGKLTKAHIQGTTSTLQDPIGITTLRLRAGIAAMVF